MSTNTKLLIKVNSYNLKHIRQSVSAHNKHQNKFLTNIKAYF